MADIKSVQMEKLEDIAEAIDWDFHECPGQESMGTNENLKAMLNYYIGEEDNYVVNGAVISCDQMSDRPVYIERKGNRIIISGEQGTKTFETFESGPDYKSCYEVKSDMEGVRKLYAVHAIKQTAGGITFATVGDCTCLRDKRENDTTEAASIISLGNCGLIGKGDAERIEKRKEDAKKFGTCYCLIRPDENWVNPYCMESVVGECHDTGGVNTVLPSVGVADILAPRPVCKKTDHHSTMRWCTTNGMEEGITMLSTLLCTRGGIITIEKSGQVCRFHQLSDEEILFISVIYGEANLSSETSWKAIANVIMNRIGEKEWANYATATDVIMYSGFDAFTDKNSPYREAETYFENRDYSNDVIERMIEVVLPIYSGEENDITGGAVLYYSPKAQEALHEHNPQKYSKIPPWDFSQLEEISIDGLDSDDDFKFYKYK